MATGRAGRGVCDALGFLFVPGKRRDGICMRGLRSSGFWSWGGLSVVPSARIALLEVGRMKKPGMLRNASVRVSFCVATDRHSGFPAAGDRLLRPRLCRVRFTVPAAGSYRHDGRGNLAVHSALHWGWSWPSCFSGWRRVGRSCTRRSRPRPKTCWMLSAERSAISTSGWVSSCLCVVRRLADRNPGLFAVDLLAPWWLTWPPGELVVGAGVEPGRPERTVVRRNGASRRL